MTEQREQRMRWYVVQAFSGYEGRVAKSLQDDGAVVLFGLSHSSLVKCRSQ